MPVRSGRLGGEAGCHCKRLRARPEMSCSLRGVLSVSPGSLDSGDVPAEVRARLWARGGVLK